MISSSSPRHSLEDEVLFDIEVPAVSLADKFGFPPFSILDRRSGPWQNRRRKWLSLGMRSELGRDQDLTFNIKDFDYYRHAAAGVDCDDERATSVFDPVVCELVYRWFSPEGGRVLDPFAGGSVRGIVASTLGRHYTGVELRLEQVESNRNQAALGSEIQPRWVEGDSRQIAQLFDSPGDEYDLVFSCPPYSDLEVYSDDSADLSNMAWHEFVAAYETCIRGAVSLLRPNSFAAWVVSDVRDKHGNYRGLVAETIRLFHAAGLHLYNDAIIVDPVGSGAMRASKQFVASRKLVRMHQHLLIFVKGDGKQAAVKVGGTAKGA